MIETVIPTDSGRSDVRTEPVLEPATTVPVMLAPPLVGPPGAGAGPGAGWADGVDVVGDVGDAVELLFPQATTESESASIAAVENAA
jgi:hypothetical protein